MKRKEWIFILAAFFIWRISLFLIAGVSVFILPHQLNFLGGGLGNYLSQPLFWGWANFDGEHYLSIAQNGYGFGEQAFFPLYPLLIRIFGAIVGNSLPSLNIVGQFISNLSFLVALTGFYKLARLDYSEKISKIALILILVFPTSFYFAAVYTESLFLALIIWSFYYARKGRWFLASIFGMFSSAARVIGIILLPVLLIEHYLQNKKIKLNAIWLAMIFLGILSFMYYLYRITGDWFKFIHTLPSFGEQRSATPILLPQVVYRYLFKILPNLNYAYFPQTFTTLLEFFLSLLFGLASVVSFLKLGLGYSLYLLGAYLLSTISGSFSSFPRYALVLFPVFIFLAEWLSRKPMIVRICFFALSFILLVVSLSMFFRGCWLA